ncbi:MarR family winged helix-turn-helix transcriptional regulator [Inquilinus sp.]|jgi:DNA-binding MarR family transcriptional regulator|uniref:MarR family winged helix-turn-helix transcriptional regulator n=1 Tax=Inquilinus sp. TaxID=1932117 RepID=UPI003783A891
MKTARNTKEGVLACNATAIRKASRRIAQMYDDALASTGLRSSQFAILAELHEMGDKAPTLAQLAASLVVDRSALGHNLRPLERDGLVTLRPGVEDRRRRHIVLTEQGRATLQQALGLWEAVQARFHAIFGQAEAEALRGTLLDIAYDDRLGTLKD